MTEYERLKRNEYQRKYYKIHIEKQRERSTEKFHRLKNVWKSKMSKEQIDDLRVKNRERQRKYYKKHFNPKNNTKTRIKNDSNELSVVGNNVLFKNNLLKMKKNIIPMGKEKPKYKALEIADVLRKHIYHKLNSKQISKWDYSDWQEFEKLKDSNEKQ
jgi:hypothetical protein